MSERRTDVIHSAHGPDAATRLEHLRLAVTKAGVAVDGVVLPESRHLLAGRMRPTAWRSTSAAAGKSFVTR